MTVHARAYQGASQKVFPFSQFPSLMYVCVLSVTPCLALPPGPTVKRSTEWVLIDMLAFTFPSLASLDPHANALHRWARQSSAFPMALPPTSKAQGGLYFPSPFQVSCGHMTRFGKWRARKGSSVTLGGSFQSPRTIYRISSLLVLATSNLKLMHILYWAMMSSRHKTEQESK